MPVLRIVLAAALVLATAWPVAAQSNEPPGPTLSVDIGLGGFTAPQAPTRMSVHVTSPVLITGRIKVSGAGISVSRPIEVPAGSEQTYELTLPPLSDGSRLAVEVVDPNGDSLARESITTRGAGGSDLVVGVLGAPELVDTLGRVRTIVTGRPVAAFSVPGDVSRFDLGVLDYLVVGRGGEEAVDTALAWAESGGAVVIDSSVAPPVPGALPMGVEGAGRIREGSGTVIVVESLASRNDTDWSTILRPAPLDLANAPEWGMNDPTALLQAASESGTRQVPSIPWLLAAIVGFALLVGPVNFVVLSRLKKRDWAWVTIPALAVVAVAGFWVAGRQRIAGTNLTHASVVVDEGGVVAKSAIVVTAGTAGERRLTFEGGTVFPEPALFGSAATELRLEGDGAATLELDQLGFTGVGVVRSDLGFELPSISIEDGQLIVENRSPHSFWGWGAVSGTSSTVAGNELAPGASGSVAIPRGMGDFGMTFIDSLMNRHQIWEDPARSASMWPLSQVLAREADHEAIYFVGITDDYQPGVAVDDGPATVPGPTLVLIEAGVAETAEVSSTASATVVGVGFINWLDWGVQRVVSTDELTVRFRLPDPALSVRLENQQRFGIAPASYEVWNWEAGAFDPFEVTDPLPSQAVSPDGEVYVRLAGQNEFGDNPMSPDDLSLVWEAS